MAVISFSLLYTSGFQSVVPRSAASASPENLLVLPIFGPHSISAELETLWCPAMCFNMPSKRLLIYAEVWEWLFWRDWALATNSYSHSEKPVLQFTYLHISDDVAATYCYSSMCFVGPSLTPALASLPTTPFYLNTYW